MTDITFTGDQQNAMDTFIDFLSKDEPVMVIQGSAGCGKSTLIKYLVRGAEKYQEMCKLLMKGKPYNELSVVLTATTNPAVAVLSELTEMEACTIHSLLSLKMVNNYRTGKQDLILKKNWNMVEDCIIVIDEGSMVDDSLMGYLKSQTRNCKILIIGDWYQLAPVGQAKTTMETLQVPIAMMNEIMRNSGIIMETGQQFRHTVETGVFKPIVVDGENIIHADGNTFTHMMEEAFTQPDYYSHFAKVVAWTNACTLQYANDIRGYKGLPLDMQVNEQVITNKPILHYTSRISVDKTVTITGMGAIYEDGKSGLVGRDTEINGKVSMFLPDDTLQVKQYVKAQSKAKNWSEVFRIKDEWLDLRLPYAATVHKAQGSGYGYVFIDLNDIGKCPIASDVARLLYVGISRAKFKVILYGQLPQKYGGKVQYA